jgi:HTH-type transcriptional regulator/antitoxin HigA
MTPKIIKSDREHEAALRHVETLMDAPAGSAAEAELELWGLLIEKYEEEHFPIARPDPVTAIEFRMEQRGLVRSDLLPYIPSKSKISEVLGRRRPLSLSMICSLQAGLGISADILVQKPRLLKACRRKPAKRGKSSGASVKSTHR